MTGPERIWETASDVTGRRSAISHVGGGQLACVRAGPAAFTPVRSEGHQEQHESVLYAALGMLASSVAPREERQPAEPDHEQIGRAKGHECGG